MLYDIKPCLPPLVVDWHDIIEVQYTNATRMVWQGGPVKAVCVYEVYQRPVNFIIAVLSTTALPLSH